MLDPADLKFAVRVNRLIDTGMDLTKQTVTGETCLHYVLREPYGCRKIRRSLFRAARLKCPELFNMTDNDGVTPLHIAADTAGI